jgi:glycosyltransferase involved in cell wall biosynthesis
VRGHSSIQKQETKINMKFTNHTFHKADLVCFSHLRWNFVLQRPQHLMSRFARARRVFFVEEAIYGTGPEASFHISVCERTNVRVVTPHLPDALQHTDVDRLLRSLLLDFLEQQRIVDYVAWFYTPMALSFADGIRPSLTVYDCMDELSLFRGAPPQLCQAEQELLERADLVFTGGISLFEAKRHRHERVYAFPSGVDVPHFFQARLGDRSHAEHGQMPRPRLGYAGVIDERLDIDLIDQLATQRPAWQIVMVGPVVKIHPSSLPQRSNLHWLGMRDYSELPRYFAGWDVGLLPFAMNDATRFISPTKTPEYLSAGLRVVSTPIRDVVRPYGELGFVKIGSNADEFIAACDAFITKDADENLGREIDSFLQRLSWEATWRSMDDLIQAGLSSHGRTRKVTEVVAALPRRQEPIHV